MAKTKTRTRTRTRTNQFAPHRTALLKKQKELHLSYERDRVEGNAAPDDGIQDLADKAASAYSKELNLSLSDTERVTLVAVDEALGRIEAGTYAVCTNCGTEVSEKRLQAIPWTAHCIDCQELQEKGLL